MTNAIDDEDYPREQEAAAALAAPAPDAENAQEKGDDPAPPESLKELEEIKATTELLKPLAQPIEDVFSTDPTKVAARKALQKAYETATASKPDGVLLGKFYAALEEFQNTARDMLLLPKADGVSRLDAWLAAYLDADKPIRTLFLKRTNLDARLNNRAGHRELTLKGARRVTALWADSFKAWSDPVTTMTALIGDSVERIRELNANINNGIDADYAIYRFWFEIAPRLLQVSPASVDETVAPGVSKVRAKLDGFPDRLEVLKSGKDRKGGKVYLIAASEFTKKREEVLKTLTAKAKEQAVAEAAFTLRPDDAASLKTRLDAVIQGEADAAKAVLTSPTP